MNWNRVTAVFGGSFDPPHRGHREAVRGLFTAPGVNRVLIMPSGTPPLKSGVTPAEHRLAMVRLNFNSTPADRYPSNVEISLHEIQKAERSLAGSATFTYDTLCELGREFPQLAFVIGSDQLRNFDRWHRFKELLDRSHWIVLERKPQGHSEAIETLSQWQSSNLARPDGGTERSWRIGSSDKRLILVETDAPEISSTAIRERITRTGVAPEGALLPETDAYLKQNRLYGSS